MFCKQLTYEFRIMLKTVFGDPVSSMLKGILMNLMISLGHQQWPLYVILPNTYVSNDTHLGGRLVSELYYNVQGHA